jgi:hypothetical protein
MPRLLITQQLLLVRGVIAVVINGEVVGGTPTPLSAAGGRGAGTQEGGSGQGVVWR